MNQSKSDKVISKDKTFEPKFSYSDYDLIVVPFYTDEYALKHFTNVSAISLASIICDTSAKYNLPQEFDNAQLKKIENYIKEQRNKTLVSKTGQIRIGFVELPMQYSKISEQLISLNIDLIFLFHTKTDPIKNVSYNTKFEQVKAVKELNNQSNTNTSVILGADDQAFLEIYNSFDNSSDINYEYNYLQTLWQTQLGQQIYRSAQYVVYNNEEFLKYFDHSQLDIDGLKNLGYYMHDMRPDMVLETHLTVLNIDRKIVLDLKQSFINYMLNCMEIRHNYICILTHWLQNTYNTFTCYSSTYDTFHSKNPNIEKNNFIFPIHTLRLIKIHKNITNHSTESIILSGFTQSDPLLPFTEQAIRYSEDIVLIRNHSYIESVSKFLPKAEKMDSVKVNSMKRDGAKGDIVKGDREIRCIESTNTHIMANQQEMNQNLQENKTFYATFCTYIYSIKQFIKQQRDTLKLNDYIKVLNPEEENIKFHLHKIFFKYISDSRKDIDLYNTDSPNIDSYKSLFNSLFSNLTPYKQAVLEIKWKDIKKHYDEFLESNNNLSEKYSSKRFYMNYSISPLHIKESSLYPSNYNVQIEARIDCILNDNTREKFILIELETSKKPILTDEIALKFFISQQRLLKYKTNAQITFYILNTEGIHEIKTEAVTKKAKKILETD